MRNKNIIVIVILLVIVSIGAALHFKSFKKGSDKETLKKVVVELGTIRNTISATGTVLPKNRLEVQPPVNGRIESIEVKEGDKVAAGEVLAWMSSTERAALLDAASGQGQETLKYWKEVYKAIPLISPIKGEVIVATTQPGQTVTTSDAVVVLSDQLIIRAQVDETDIGKIKLNMPAVISLDAYPDEKIEAFVEHIYYESETVNNVTIYKVDLIPSRVPSFSRSGMNATIDFIYEQKENVLVVPLEFIDKENGQTCVLKVLPGEGGVAKVAVTTGLSDDKNIEIVSGVHKDDRLALKGKKYSLPTSNTGSNPFMPGRKR